MKRNLLLSLIACVAVCTGIFAIAQQPPPPRLHRITSKGVLKPLPAETAPPLENKVTIEVVGDQRIIRSNGIPNHKTGQFPNPGNPNKITAQKHEYRVPANPKMADKITPMHGEFGVAINGVPFDPGAGEFYQGEPGWQYEPLSGAIELGIDVSHAHVQPTGKYHYHGLPTGLLDSVKLDVSKHSPLIGWAADGFPMYAVYGYSDPKNSSSPIKALKSSYQLKKGDRPGGDAPDGKYDGTFVRDYEYIAGSGDLDECNGRYTITPEFPKGTYAYFMTEDWPVVPRNYRGTPSEDFRHGPRGVFPSGGEPGGQPGQFAGGPGMRAGPPGGPGGRQGGTRQGRPKPGEVLPSFVRDWLNLTDEQIKQLDSLQKTVDERLFEILSDQQRKQLENAGPPGGGRPGQGGFGGPPEGGRPRSRPQ